MNIPRKMHERCRRLRCRDVYLSAETLVEMDKNGEWMGVP